MAGGRPPWFTPSIGRVMPFIQRGVREGLSASEMSRMFRAQGLVVRRTNLLAAIRSEKGVELSRDYIRSVRKDRRFDPARIATSASKIRREFSFSVEVRGFNAETGVKEARHVQISFEGVLTPGEIESRAMELAAREEYGKQFVVESALISRALRVGGAGIL